MSLLSRYRAWRNKPTERELAARQNCYEDGYKVGEKLGYDRGFIEGASVMQRKISEHPDVYLLANRGERVN